MPFTKFSNSINGAENLISKAFMYLSFNSSFFILTVNNRTAHRLTKINSFARNRFILSEINELFSFRIIVPIGRILPATFMSRQMFIPCKKLYVIRITLVFRILSGTLHVLAFQGVSIVVLGFPYIGIKDFLSNISSVLFFRVAVKAK